METNNHNGSEFRNVTETWDQNEKQRASGNTGGAEGSAADDAAPATELEQIIKQEASEYDNDNKEDRILGGDRATVNDEEGSTSGE